MPDYIIGRTHPRVVQLWDALLAAESAARRFNTKTERSYRNGLLNAYAIITGEDEESIHEDIEAALIARAESMGEVL